MAGNSMGLARGQVRTLFEAGSAAGLTDGQLLERFATRRDDGAELAFAALVDRHGPMVLRACRALLGDHHDAMDAFQATFLVLARKGGSLWVRDSIGPWLHRVALHAAGRARASAARRKAVEAHAAEFVAPRGGDDGRDEVVAVVHEEVERLPGRYRAAVVLCDLEGRTREEAARHLGCAVGTVDSRLSRGRMKLRDRLRRRGLDPASGLIPGTSGWLPVSGGSMPAGLAGSTAFAAVRFVTIRAARVGPAAPLATGVIRSMSMMQLWKTTPILLALGASTSAVVASRDAGLDPARPEEKPQAAAVGEVVEVKRGRLDIEWSERGNLEASRNASVSSQLEVSGTIIRMSPEYSRVTKGQVVCELDSSALRDQLTVSQATSVPLAEAVYQVAKLAREAAEIAVNEYDRGSYPSDLRSASREIELAHSAVARAVDRLKRTGAARERLGASLAGQGGAKAPAEIVAELDIEDRLASAELALDRARKALEDLQGGRDVLEKFTRHKTVHQLRAEVEKARADELIKQASLTLEKSKEAKLALQIDACKMLAPIDGVMTYISRKIPYSGGTTVEEPMDVGSRVQKGQPVFEVSDLSSMQLMAKVHESIVDQLKVGNPVRITVDAFPDRSFAGVVEEIPGVPDRVQAPGSGFKAYSTRISIKDGIPGLRPGMTAKAEIRVASVDDALTVPIGAIVPNDDLFQVAIRTPAGGVEWRDVTLGRSDDKVIEIKTGLKAGESVVVDPVPLLSGEQKLRIALRPPRSWFYGAGMSPALVAKFRALSPADRNKIRDAGAALRAALLKKAGLTDEEARIFGSSGERPDDPR